jgi:hypothetical protein
MKIKFTLNAQMDAGLIKKIKKKANGGSINEAAKFWLRFWHEQEKVLIGPLSGQKVVSIGSELDPESESDEINLSGLDEIDLDL